MNKVEFGNPAVVGLGGFGLSTILLQLHTLGLCGLGPVLAVGFAFGGVAQLCAGLLEHKNGNNFGFAAFSAYGSFWLSIAIIWILNYFGMYKSSTTDVGYFLIAYTLFTLVLWVASLFIHSAMATTFSILMVGFLLLDLGHFGFPALNIAAAYVLIACALAAWYMMAAIIINGVAGRTILNVGEAWIKPGAKELIPATN